MKLSENKATLARLALTFAIADCSTYVSNFRKYFPNYHFRITHRFISFDKSEAQWKSRKRKWLHFIFIVICQFTYCNQPPRIALLWQISTPKQTIKSRTYENAIQSPMAMEGEGEYWSCRFTLHRVLVLTLPNLV